MNIIVCVKAILDPETAAHYVVSGVGLQIEEQGRKIIPEGIETILSPFDALAVEAALRLKDNLGSVVTITAISLGNDDSLKILRRVLAMGVDHAVLLKDSLFEDANDVVAAQVLAAAIRKVGAFDLIICGRQAADVDSGVVGSGLSELLEVPCVTVAKDIQVQGKIALVERTTPEAVEKIELPLPAVVTVSSELGEPRYPKMRKIIEAKKKDIPVWDAQDLGLTPERIAIYNNLLRLERIAVVEMQGQCEFLEGESIETVSTVLIQRLREGKILPREASTK